MNRNKGSLPLAFSMSLMLAMALALATGSIGTVQAAPKAAAGSVIVSVFVPPGSMNNPRGLKFGPDGNLYVAEGGYPTGVLTEAPAGLGGNCSAGANGPTSRSICSRIS